MSLSRVLQSTRLCTIQQPIFTSASRYFSANSKRKTKAHELLFAKTNVVAPVKIPPTDKPKSSKSKDKKKSPGKSGGTSEESTTKVFHDPVTGISMGISQELLQHTFMSELANKIEERNLSPTKLEELAQQHKQPSKGSKSGVSKGAKKQLNKFDDSDMSDEELFFDECSAAEDVPVSADDMEVMRMIREMSSKTSTPSPGAKATVHMYGRDLEVDGFTQEQVDELLASESEGNEEEDDIISDSELKQIGLTREELDADVIPRIEIPRQPAIGQLPLPNISKLTYDIDIGKKYSTLIHEVPFDLKTSDQALSLRVCIVGTPNAGKSAFVNSMSRLKVTAVSPKRNTTRRQTIGVATEGNTQIVLFDTPGINEIQAAKQYQRELATEAWDSVGDADMVLVVMDAAKHMGGPELFLLHKCREIALSNPNITWVLVLNKIDLVEPKDKLMTYLNRTITLFPELLDCFMISSITGDGVADIENYIFNNAVPREWEHEGDTRTDQNEVQHATEIIREVLYNRLNKEIPYMVQQQNIGFEVLRNGEIRIDQRIIVRKQQHKEILMGLNGKTLRSVTQTAAIHLQNTFGRKVHLFLRVNVNENQDFSKM